MALTYSAFTTFAEVEAYYNNTTPMRGDNNVGKDIRPIGDRNRKWERIVKISPNCYALSDGHHYGDEHFPVWHNTSGYESTLKDMERYAPIVWRKKRDGTETVTFRNGTGEGAHNGRYAFLWRHTPRGLHFRNSNGKHFIATSDTAYFLAKGRTIPRAVYDKLKADVVANPNNPWIVQRARHSMVHDDNASLTFTNVQGKWEWVGGGRDIPVAPKKRVDLKAKAKLKPYIAAFRDWAFAIIPMLPSRDYQYQQELRAQAKEWAAENKVTLANIWSVDRMFSPETARDILLDEEHPMRLHLAVALRAYIDNAYNKAEDDAQLKAQFNRWVNYQLGLIKEVKG